MKKFFFFLSTIALLGLASACVERISSDNPNYNAEKGEVKTEFVINIASTIQTKATAKEVQVTNDGGVGTFLGMEGVRLFMSKGYGATYEAKPYQYDLGTVQPIYGKAPLATSTDITTTDSRRVYKMTMPTDVDNMVFYAKAPTVADSWNQMVYPFSANAENPTKTNTFFGLKPIVSANLDLTADASATAILAILNAVAATTGWSATDDVTLATAYNNFVNTEAIVITDDDDNTPPTVKETLRQGSASAVLRTMQDLYNLVKDATEPTTGTSVAWNIKSKLLEHFTAATDGTLSYKSTAIVANFPQNLKLPVGVAQVKCTVTTSADSAPTAKFSWVSPTSNTMATSETEGLDYRNLRFPPELCYWADSPIRVSNTEGVDEPDNNNNTYYPNGVANWDNDDAWASATGNWLSWTNNKKITKDTRAVALKNNVLYGTALAKTFVKLSNTTLDDNRKVLVPHLTDQTITVSGTVDNKPHYFTVKGILIGGQPDQVGWNFVDGGTTRTAVVYDNAFDHTADEAKITTSNSKPFYTLVFDNYKAGVDNPDAVYIALELENHAGDFYGKDNVIYDGGTFYLAGKMQLTATQIADLKKTTSDYGKLSGTTYRIPPVATDGSAMTLSPRIFMQDFVTEITLTLGENALKHAYATIPDLRPIDMYFGLSVDLKWKTGAALSVEL